MAIELLASSQSGRNIDSDAWCKRTLTITNSQFSREAGRTTQYLLTTDGRLLPIVVRSKADGGTVTKQVTGEGSRTTTTLIIRKRASAPRARTGNAITVGSVKLSVSVKAATVLQLR